MVDSVLNRVVDSLAVADIVVVVISVDDSVSAGVVVTVTNHNVPKGVGNLPNFKTVYKMLVK